MVRRTPAALPMAPDPPAEPAWADDSEAAAPSVSRESLLDALLALETRTTLLAEAISHERPNRRFGDALTGFAREHVFRLREQVESSATLDTADRLALDRGVMGIRAVVDQIESLIEQRRDPLRLAELGDADALADACYQPILTFARAEGLPVTSSSPATLLGEFQLSIWTGFIPTSIAPIFLPPDFFRMAAFWPAIAHEIGHDFLASIRGLNAQLRVELGVATEDEGSRPLAFEAGRVSPLAIERVFGAWFEELFCDVFGTLMCGPAYVATMEQLFAAENDAREVLVVWLEETGSAYDVHPPRHLRLLAGCLVLERAGFHSDALRLRERWEARHTVGERRPDRLLFPGNEHYLAIPLDLFLPFLDRIVDRLYAGPIRALSSHGLRDISGLDYGLHAHAESERARNALLGGVVPRVRDPRAVVAGAVLAAAQRPDLEALILANARAAIPALGTTETRPDAYSNTAVPGAIRTDEIATAMVFREILGRPRSTRYRR